MDELRNGLKNELMNDTSIVVYRFLYPLYPLYPRIEKKSLRGLDEWIKGGFCGFYEGEHDVMNVFFFKKRRPEILTSG